MSKSLTCQNTECGRIFTCNWARNKCFECKPQKKRWSKEECQTIALLYSSRSCFKKNNNKVYVFSHKMEWLEEICKHMEYKYKYWTYDLCLVAALKCKSKVEFREKYSSEYRAAEYHDWMADVCSHMVCNYETFTYEDCEYVASICSTKKELYTLYPKQYRWLVRRGLLDKACEHLTNITVGQSRSSFIKSCDRNNRGVGILYLLLCYDDHESFYKIGITSLSVESRYHSTDKLFYDYDIIWEIEGPSGFIWDCEFSVKSKISKNLYVPEVWNRRFSTECFIDINLI